MTSAYLFVFFLLSLIQRISQSAVDGESVAKESAIEQLTTQSADWATYNHDVRGWRFNAAEKELGPGNVGQLVEKWRFPAASSNVSIGVVHATPSVVNDEVYFGTATFPAFYKLNKRGEQVWVYRNADRESVLPPSTGTPISDKLRATASSNGIMTSGLIVDGAVYFADLGGMIYSLDAATERM